MEDGEVAAIHESFDEAAIYEGLVTGLAAALREAQSGQPWGSCAAPPSTTLRQPGGMTDNPLSAFPSRDALACGYQLRDLLPVGSG
jgi:hypothetical protein